MDRLEEKMSIAARASRDARITRAPILGTPLDIAYIADEEDGPAVAVAITLPNGDQVWSGEISQNLYERQEPEAQDELGGHHGDFVISSTPGQVTILARAADRWAAMDLALAYAEWRSRLLAKNPAPDDTGSERSEHRDVQITTSLHSEEKEETR